MAFRHAAFSPVAMLPRLVTRSPISATVCIAASPTSIARYALTLRRLASTLPRFPIFEALVAHDPESTAVIHALSRRSFSYGQLLTDVSRTKELLDGAEPTSGWSTARHEESIEGQRVAFLVENSYDYVVMLLAAIAARAVAIPLSPDFPASELQYILKQSSTSLLVSSPRFAAKASEVLGADPSSNVRYITLPKHDTKTDRSTIQLEDKAQHTAGMMLYTSGTTGRPKGVLLLQSALNAQCQSLVEAWKYSPSDRLLHFLPLHHIHGIVNAILTPLFAGSTIEFMFPFNPDAVWKRLAAPFLPDGAVKDKINFMTAVPTVYHRLMSTHKTFSPEVQEAASQAVSPEHMRLTISGSAALPTPVKAAWKDLSRGTVLLERYGMTEIGMALSCGLDFADRVDASVGWPLPSVEVRLVDVDTGDVILPGEELNASGRLRLGEVQVRGPTIFKEYWANPEETAKSFTPGEDGGLPWFKTGDVAVRCAVPSAGQNTAAQPWARGDMYFIQGRMSSDIIKTGGEKISALEVERELMSLPEVAAAAVVGIPDPKWGQKLAAAVELDPEHASTWTLMDMRRALKDRLAKYKIPQKLTVVDQIPRNAMGKINKKKLVADMA